ncbi:hypothetical protein DL96DRAFT_1583058 [Flagelloscypha sp. PMI_526]|nr:hypothetical protein DL96DRAFT_1583058 [Flagelloscypha sp. PMI_526]
MDALPAEGSQSRKRQRSSSMHSNHSHTSNKRAASDPLDPTTPAPTVAVADSDIDAYMDEQDPDSPDSRFQIFQELSNRPLLIGQTWYLVSKKWHRKWLNAHDPASKEPVDPATLGPVDNTDLFDSVGSSTLRRPLIDDLDVVFVPEEAWANFENWYGKSEHPLPRKVVGRGQALVPVIETHPIPLRVHRIVKDQMVILPTAPGALELSETDTLATLCQQAADSVRGTPQKDAAARVYILADPDKEWKQQVKRNMIVDNGHKLLEPSDTPLAEVGIEPNDALAVDFNAQSGWILEPAPATSSSSSSSLFTTPGFFDKSGPSSTAITSSKSAMTSTMSSYFKTPRTISQPIDPGTLGLGNLGNTCFMNSALQCLAHNQELTDYFLSGVYREELNPDNPLGMKGAIAQGYAELIHRIWSDKSSSGASYSPREFKTQLARFAPQFSGYQQHDSQELVAFLLDGLHEDLNRVLKKPYVEKPDWPDNVDPEVHDVELAKLAKESWDGYKLRNDSVIVDLFQGQYQSTLVCPECQKISITFDPFMYLTLPLPISQKWAHHIYFIPWDDEQTPLKIPVMTKANATWKDVRQLLGRWTNTPPDNLVTMETFQSRFYKGLDDNTIVSDTTGNDVVVCYQFPCHGQQSRTYKRAPGDPYIVPVQLETQSASRYGGTYRFNNQLFGQPTLALITEEEAQTPEGIYAAIMRRLKRWSEVGHDLYRWEASGGSGSNDIQEVVMNGIPPVDAVAEITENGEVVTVQEGAPATTAAAPEEGDIVDEKVKIVTEDGTSDSDDGPQVLHCLGPKPDIFNIRFLPADTGYATSSWHSSRSVDLDTRLKEATEEEPSLVRENETIVCEFDANMRDYYFGEEQNRFNEDAFERLLHPEFEAARDSLKSQGKKEITLKDCLDEFTREEELGEDDLWLQTVLVVHLKRFSNNRIMRDKIDALVEFPTKNLVLTDSIGEKLVGRRLKESGKDGEELAKLGIDSEQLDQELVYDLFGVDEHIGGLGGGHYRAYAENHLSGKWYHFDDSYVSPSDPESSVNRNAYLLFYRRRGSGPLGGVSHAKTKEALEKKAAEPAETMDTALDNTSTDDFEARGWTQISSSDYPPASSHPSISIANDSRLHSLNTNEWRNALPSTTSTSSGISTPPDDEPLSEYQDPLSLSNSAFDQGLSFPDPSNRMGSFSSPGSSAGAEADDGSDRDEFYHRDFSHSPRMRLSQVDDPEESPPDNLSDSSTDSPFKGREEEDKIA